VSIAPTTALEPVQHFPQEYRSLALGAGVAQLDQLHPRHGLQRASAKIGLK
jgi:hypothetical protein